jgi:hypothetical protein
MNRKANSNHQSDPAPKTSLKYKPDTSYKKRSER